MKEIKLKQIAVKDIYVSVLRRRRTSGAEGWSRLVEARKDFEPTGSLFMDAVGQVLMEDVGLTARELARALGVEGRVLSGIFRLLTGMDAEEFLTRYRLEKAKEWLARTDLRAGEVARRSGFPSQASLTTYFKTRLKMTPLEYRERYRPRDFRSLYEWDK